MQAFWFSLLLAAPVGQASPKSIDDFTLRDYRGTAHKLSDWYDRKLVVVVFLGVECPLANLYGPRLVELAREYEPRGVRFVGLNPNQHDSVSELAAYARRHRVTFPLLKDTGNAVADRFEAKRTPEVFVLDERRVVRYQGRIDDQYLVGSHRTKATRRDLAEALDDLLAGRPVRQPATEATGCVIDRVHRSAAKGEVTYTKHVAAILQQRCQVCHRPGNIAPFSLTSYEQAFGWAETIREVVAEGRMPPWHADPKHGKFANDPRLNDEQKRLIEEWVKGGCPEGDPADLPPAPRFPEGWSIPDPDLIISMPQPFTVPAEGIVEYQMIEADPGFKEDRWVKAAEILPGNRAVVHHCNVFLKPPGVDGLGEVGTLGSSCFAGLAPGTPPLFLPEGMAKRVPAGWHFLFVMHYTTTGKIETDQTRLGLVFADPKTVKKEVATKIMLDTELAIPPHAADHVVSQTWQVNDPVLLISLFPHMHLRGKAFRYEAVYPDGTGEILLDVRYDFNWQNRYILAEPKLLPAGSYLRCTAHFDNSSGNPNNPDPSATVRAGPQSWDEMFNGYFEVVLADEDLTDPATKWRELWAAVKRACSPGFAAVFAVCCGAVFMVKRRLGRTPRRAAGFTPAVGAKRPG